MKLLTSWSWQDSRSVSECIKNWEEGEQLQNGFLCSVLNGELFFERFEMNVKPIETNYYSPHV